MLDDYTYEEVESGRVETLVQAIDKIEILEKQLKIAVEALEYYDNKDNYDRHHQVVNGSNEWDSNVMIDCGTKAEQALQKIKELDK